MASEIWSATLSGWPSETDSEVKRYSDMKYSTARGEKRSCCWTKRDLFYPNYPEKADNKSITGYFPAVFSTLRYSLLAVYA
jgi:hypothetical protein